MTIDRRPEDKVTIDPADLNRKLDRITGELTRQVGDLREEIALISGGAEARIAARRELRDHLDRALLDLSRARNENAGLRDQLIRTRREATTLRDQLTNSTNNCRELRDQLDATQTKLDQDRRQLHVDGDLLCYVITEACPPAMTDDQADEIATNAVTELARIGPGVIVFSGHTDNPWVSPRSQPDTPDRTATSASYTDGCITPTGEPDIPGSDHTADNDGVRVNYGVLRGSKPGEKAALIVAVSNREEGRRAAKALPGSWVGKQITITQRWIPVD